MFGQLLLTNKVMAAFRQSSLWKSMAPMAMLSAVPMLGLAQVQGVSSSKTPYLTPVAAGVEFTSVLTTGDAIGGYKMVGIPDGLGAYDNGDGTFTLLMNHELQASDGVVRAHGGKGAFVSKWVINKSTLAVQAGSDLIQTVKLWNPTTSAYETASNVAFGRFCSADLPAVSAFYNAATGLGTQARIFMNGEETGNEGRALGHIVTGTEAGITYELPRLGKASWENAVASPHAQNKTIVVTLDDTTPGQVYFYVGTKTNTGSDIEKAGLTNGKLYGIKVTGLLNEVNASVPAAGTAFTMVDLGNVENKTGATLQSESNDLGVTQFLRPEDGAWDPANPRDFYFATTNSFSGNSRLWRLRFTDITKPEAGGTIEAVLEGGEGHKMLDNITVDKYGHVLLVEDVGGNAHLGKTWEYNIATDELLLLASHDASRFLTGGANFITEDEELSGILDVQDILGVGMFIAVDQVHNKVGGEEVEGGQLLTLYNPNSAKLAAVTGPNSSQTPYVEPVAEGVKVNAVLTVTDAADNGYKMVGIPDGLGAYDNGDGTFTLLMNHELGATAGVARAHGGKGSFVSKWVINKSTLAVQAGSDLIQTVKLWNPATSAYETASNVAFGRFCSADLPEATAFYNAATGLGTQVRIFMNGEETGNEGRALGHIATGTEAGTSYELPRLGKASWENAVASPHAQDKTIVVTLDDTTPGQVYFYVGTKTNTGSDIDKAGLTNGKLYGIKVTGLLNEVNASVPAAGTVFSMVDLGNVENKTGATLNSESNDLGVTQFLRPEDGAWDPANPRDFYFATTNSFSGNSRLWRLRFTDITKPETGGTIEAVLEGGEGQKMIDNITVDKYGHVLFVEDVGGNAHNGKVWQYNTKTDELKMLAKHDPSRFEAGGSRFLTEDEEVSGILDVEDILGAGMFIAVDQTHYTIPGEFVEGGQLLTLFNPDTYEASQVTTSVEPEIKSDAVASFAKLYPNPANESATVELVLEKRDQVTVNVYDLQGAEVLAPFSKTFDKGQQNILLNTSALPAGVYHVQITSSTSKTVIRTLIIH